ncbi:MAG: tetratricopeptide repeat protein [Armatimonadota bacterium]
MSNQTDILHHLRSWQIRAALVIGCLLMSGVSAYAGIALELKTPRSVYLLDEPIYATVTLHNTGKTDAKVFRHLELGDFVLSVYITSPDGETYQINPMVHIRMTREGMENGIIRLYPDKSFGTMLEIMNRDIRRNQDEYLLDGGRAHAGFNIRGLRDDLFGNLYREGFWTPEFMPSINAAKRKAASIPRMTFEKPGRYVIRCKYSTNGELRLDPTPVYSNRLIVRIDAPKGDDLLVHKRLLEGSDKLSFGVWDTRHERIPLYEELLEKYPKSAYAVHIKYRLAESCHGYGLVQLRGKETSYPILKKAAELFSQAADESVGSPMSPYIMRIAGRAFAEIGDNEKATALMIASFTSKDSTEQDHMEILSWIRFIENGMYHSVSGTVKYASDYTVWVPLESFASLIGYMVKTPGESIYLFYANLVAVLDASKGTLSINDNEPVKVRVRIDGGRVLVAPEVIGRLMAAKYGEEGSKSFKYLIDGPKLP